MRRDALRKLPQVHASLRLGVEDGVDLGLASLAGMLLIIEPMLVEPANTHIII